MLTEKQIVDKYNNGEKLVISVIGDSVTSGIEANSGPILWTNGVAYAATNQPNAYPNLDPNSPYYINDTTYPSQAQQDNLAIPTAVRQFRTLIEAKNATSVVTNWGIPGWDAAGHLSSGTVALVAAQNPKPDVVIINLGINSAKNRVSMLADLRTLVDQVLAEDIFVLLAQPNNIGVVGSPAGSWDQTSLPDTWFPLDYWPTTVAEIKTVSSERNTGFVNTGTADLQLEIEKLYDPFHPNEVGFADIASRYLNWFAFGSSEMGNGAMIKTINGKSYYQSRNGNEAFKARMKSGQIVSMPLTRTIDQLRIRAGSGKVTFE
ncbi:SGNH hydrolase-type esterase domain protein [Vibrio phage 1.211.B._10N.222.52.F11]|nr:SGNH hydrolase-type esterase domain protein [Vibrio phage 1.211.A._10N.222.52.F11]AUR95752.1 SGNH hydrolase-type esterase domain protein [Vibrio phage 1.211.B._10N.222.52.F11]